VRRAHPPSAPVPPPPPSLLLPSLTLLPPPKHGSKFPTSIAANGDPLVKPAEVNEFDYEVELAVVIGKAGRRIKEEDALAHVAGYTVAHDVSARDWQLKKNGGQWLLGKCADGFAPLGPSIVTPDEVGDVHNLRLRCIVGGEVLQEGSTKELVHNVPKCIAWISKLVTLNPGDVILTGTPPGVGCFRKPQRWLQVGETVTVEIEKLGAISNTVVADSTA
jgi:2-keto-4-pentenoate hydratase/2-oxohepta-3-ene-1,7-dioic acid hydratase in catechol pathway